MQQPMIRTSEKAAGELAEEARKCGTVKKYDRGRKRTIVYYNAPCSFDIETTNFRTERGMKAATMYIWMFGINGRCVYGRTWLELQQLLSDLHDLLDLTSLQRLVCYVHNLSFEFQFIRRLFEWEDLFALEERKPVYALTAAGVEMRCSYILTAKSLEKVGKDLLRCPVEKLTGYLDYDLMRGSGTVLDDKELAYCKHDILVVMSLIIDKLVQDGRIDRIPLTKTGYVRRHMRTLCLYAGNPGHRKAVSRTWKDYRQKMKALQLDPYEYNQCKRAFAGGFVHASAHWSGQILEGVRSYDIASSYPTVMCCEKFPMSRARVIHRPEWDVVLHECGRCCCLLDLEITGLMASDFTDHPLSASKCLITGSWQEDNGRLVCADHVITTCTDVDLEIFRMFYTWDHIECRVMRCYLRDYLPRRFIEGILGLYKDKTTLKGVPGMEVEYMLAKEDINSCYGAAVTDIVRPSVVYTKDGWRTVPADLDEEIRKYNNSKGRFLFYPWGVWVTAYARRNIFAAIREVGPDYVYSDTDSVKLLNAERHEAFFERYNRRIQRKLHDMCSAYGFDPELTRPKDSKGRPRPLGVFEDEGTYDRFKTLGAKRYLTEKNGDFTLTCSGVNKKAVEFLKNAQSGDFVGIFGMFDDGLYIPGDQTGKLTHTYIDEPLRGVFTDWRGELQEWAELSAVHLSDSDYSLGLSQKYIDYLLAVRHELV